MYNQKVAAVKRLKKESMYGLSAKKVAVVQRWPLWGSKYKIVILTFHAFFFCFIVRVCP